MSTIKLYLILSIVLLLCRSTFADETEMNGYRLKDFSGFEKKWRLVTVRYRKDTDEMRFAYANALAWKTLVAGRTDYPKGAVFAKIGLKATGDPAFASSMGPNGARRYQFMVRDEKKHKSTQGWGYALFDKEGKRFPENVEVQSNACASCHYLVRDRGHVFSFPMSLSEDFEVPHSLPKVQFEDGVVSVLPMELRARLPEPTQRVRLVTGALRESLFQGTLDEIRPLLAQEVAESSVPVVLLDKTKKRFSAVLPGKQGQCKAGMRSFQAFHNIAPQTTVKAKESESRFFESSFCQ